MAAPVSWRFLRLAGRMWLQRNAEVTVSGLERIPANGPVIIAARHYHHLYDGCALAGWTPRPVFLVVALDWVANPVLARVMSILCSAARWPVVLRAGRPSTTERAAASRPDRAGRQALRSGAGDVVRHLREGNVVVVFPEGYPNVDPGWTPKTGDGFLPFQPGFATLARLAERQRADRVAVVPVGFRYERPDRGGRWAVRMRIGDPRRVDEFGTLGGLVAAIEADVHRLSERDEPYR